MSRSYVSKRDFIILLKVCYGRFVSMCTHSSGKKSEDTFKILQHLKYCHEVSVEKSFLRFKRCGCVRQMQTNAEEKITK